MLAIRVNGTAGIDRMWPRPSSHVRRRRGKDHFPEVLCEGDALPNRSFEISRQKPATGRSRRDRNECWMLALAAHIGLCTPPIFQQLNVLVIRSRDMSTYSRPHK